MNLIYQLIENLIVPTYEWVVARADTLLPFVPTIGGFVIGFTGMWLILRWGTKGHIIGAVVYAVALDDLLPWVHESYVKSDVIVYLSLLLGAFGAYTFHLRGTQPENRINRLIAGRPIVPCLLVVFVLVSVAVVHIWYTPRIWNEVTVALKWKHQSQFAGLYVAEEKQYFKDEGIKIKLLAGGPEEGQDPFERVKKGDADFGIGDPINLIIENSEAHPLKAIAVIFQTSPAVWFLRGDEKQFRPYDLIGKTVAVSTTGRTNIDRELDLWLRKQIVRSGNQRVSLIKFVVSMNVSDFLDLDKSQRQRYKGVILEVPLRRTGLDSLGHFLAENIDVWTGYTSNEFLAAKRLRPNASLIPIQSNPPIYGDILFTSEKVLNNKRELVKRFMNVFRRGWEDAIKPEREAEVLSLIMQRVADTGSENRVHQLEMLQDLREKTRDTNGSFGSMTMSRWSALLGDLQAAKLISKDMDANTLFDPRFLED